MAHISTSGGHYQLFPSASLIEVYGATDVTYMLHAESFLVVVLGTVFEVKALKQLPESTASKKKQRVGAIWP